MDLNFNYFCSIIVQKKRKKNLLKKVPLNTEMDLYRFVVAFGFFLQQYRHIRGGGLYFDFDFDFGFRLCVSGAEFYPWFGFVNKS